jgi:hypothetical protein
MDPRAAHEFPAGDVMDRKYSGSWVIMDDSNGNLSQVWVDAAGANPFKFVSRDKEITDKWPVYYPIESGYYVDKKERCFLVERAFTPHKSFKVGFSGNGWKAHEVNTGTGTLKQWRIDPLLELDLLNPPDRKPFLSRGLGVASRRYLITLNRAFYKGNQIGLRLDNKIMLDNHVFKQDLIKTLGPLWQVC